MEPHRREIYGRILAIVRDRGQHGATLKELAVALNKEKSDFSGRLTELIGLGVLQVMRGADGREVNRDRCRVLVVGG